MAFVTLTRDFSQIKKPLPGINLEKRQLISLIAGAALALPAYFIIKPYADITVAALAAGGIMFPIYYVFNHKKDGLYMEKHLKYYYETHHVRNTDRPYVSENYYDLLMRETELKKEVERIVFQGKSKQEIQRIKKSGETTTVKINKKKFTIPGSGPVDKETKKELERAIQKAKLKGDIPESAQDTIQYKNIYENGIMEFDDNYFSMAIAFEDINYQQLDDDDKDELFERWCRLINCFMPGIHFQFFYQNREMNRKDYAKDFIIPLQNDGIDLPRKEYSNVTKTAFEKGANNIKKERFVIFGIKANNYNAAKVKLGQISKLIQQKLTVLKSKSYVLKEYERLECFYYIFHPATQKPFMWNVDLGVKSGLSSKDFICNSGFSFKSAPELNATKYFRTGDRIGAVSRIQINAADMDDRIINDILAENRPIMISIHGDMVPRNQAINQAMDNITDVDSMIVNNQKDAVQSGYDMDILPPHLKIYQEAGQKLLRGLEKKNENLFNVTMTIVQTADTRKKLEEDVDMINEVLQGFQSELVRLDNRQEQGYITTLPFGINQLEVKRSFSTTDVGIFIPFTTKEIYTPSGQYYGMNTLSNYVIMANRKKLANPNGLVLGKPGFGKTFFIKREILDIFLKTDDDILINDPEGEYVLLTRMLKGQVLDVSLNSDVYINPLEIDMDAKNEDDEEYDPIAEKCEFVVSMVETMLKNPLTDDEIAVIDEAANRMYSDFSKNPIPENQPILSTLQEYLNNLHGNKGLIGKGISLKINPYVTGTLSWFNHRSTIDIKSRMVCFNQKNMAPAQRKLTMLIIENLIWGRVKYNRARKKYTDVYIDEFHLMLQTKETAAHCVEIWKRFRKWGGIPTGITQNVKDLFRSAEIQNILDTTNFFALLTQGGDDARLLSAHFDLSEEEEDRIKTEEVGKGLLIIQGVKIPFEDEFPDNTVCYKIMSTKPDEMLQAKKKKQTV